MNGFKKAFRAELKKTAGRKKIKLALILCLLCVVLSAAVCALAGSFMGINMTGRAELSVTVLPVFTKFLIPLFTVFMCIDIFGGEYGSGTMKTTLLTGATRAEIYFAKAAVLGAFIVLMLGFSMVSSFIASVIVGKTEFNVLRVLFSYIISAVPLMSFAFMSMLVSNIFKGSGSSFMITVLLYIASWVIGTVFPFLSGMLVTSTFDVYVLLSQPILSFGKIIRLLTLSVGLGAVFAGVGEHIFERKEL